MRLKNLKIFGFKSFADSVTLDFTGDIIAIVGPNGCGKSNIVDAIRWVMGEQSAKSMRGDRMQDILFAGCEGRSPLHLAEVAVSFTHAAETLSLPYEEITLTRKLHRSGESEYLFNKQPIRLKELQLLFSGKGIGKNAFSIFEQGKLDQIIHLSPLERRHIFDDAAQIGRFLQQKKEIVRKLEEVTENYQRARDIYTEVEKHTTHLKKQAAQAHHYQDQKKRYHQLEMTLLYLKRKIASDDTIKIQSQIQIFDIGIQKHHGVLQQLEQEILKLNKKKEAHEISFKEKRERLYEVKSLLQVALQEQKRVVEKIAEFEATKKSHAKELAAISHVQKELENATLLTQKELAAIVLEEQKKQVEAARHILSSYDQKVKELQSARKIATVEHLSELEKEKKISETKQRKELEEENYKQRREANLKKKKSLKQDQTRMQGEITENAASVTALIQTIDQCKEELVVQEKRVKELRLLRDQEHKKLLALTAQIEQVSARQTALLQLKKDFEGFSSGAKKLLASAQDKHSLLYQKVFGLSDEIAFDEIPVMQALDPYLETLVVKTRADLECVIAFATQHAIHGFSLLCLEIVPKSQFLFGTRIDQSLSSLLSKKQFREKLTQEGFWVDSQGVIFSPREKNQKSNAFLREKELGHIHKELIALKKEQHIVQKQLENIRLELEQEEAKRSLLEIEQRKKEMSLIEANFSLQTKKNDFVQVNKMLEQVLQEISTQESISIKLEKEILELQAALKTLKTSIREKQDQCHEKDTAFEVLLHERQLVFQKMQEEERAYDASAMLWKKLYEESKRLELKKQACHLNYERLIHEEKSYQAAFAKAQENKESLILQVTEMQKELSTLTAFSLEWEDTTKAIQKETKTCENQLHQERTSALILENQKTQGAISLAEKTQVLKNLDEMIQARASVNPDFVPIDLPLKQIESEMQELLPLLERAGGVNLTAIEEYKKEQVRCDFLKEQLIDLESSQTELETILVQLDGESRKIFKDTFQLIRSYFQKNFSILFQGGTADLKFTDSPDVLEAGIEIMAQPPGKQMRALSLLSGGEKCLVALALLFAIFEVRPAPFCILDEVDAPLDDANVERFTRMLKQFTPQTQFLIVTHNKKTMKIADKLMGVSMQTRGISQLIALEFAK